MKPEFFTLTLESSRMITNRVKHFVFHLSNHNTLNYLPGQFITLYFEHQGQTIHRSYSLASAPNQEGRLEFAASLIPGGVASSFLDQLQPQDTIQARGPFGRLILKESAPKRYILIGTSTGITPYRAMLTTLKQTIQNSSASVVILQGVPLREDCLYHEEFTAFSNTHERATYHACLSRAEKTNSSEERLGHVQDILKTLNPNPLEDVVYLCGNPNMVDQTYQLLESLNFSTQHIVREKYISR